MMAIEAFGCARCFQADALSMAQARQNLIQIARLVDESHFDVVIRACPACRQQCVSVFTEMIDWQDGDDPQCVSILPLTASEAQQLMTAGEDVVALIERFGRKRRYLQVDHPKGAPERIGWVDGGLVIGPHD
jgi:hypothetical protein